MRPRRFFPPLALLFAFAAPAGTISAQPDPEVQCRRFVPPFVKCELISGGWDPVWTLNARGESVWLRGRVQVFAVSRGVEVEVQTRHQTIKVGLP